MSEAPARDVVRLPRAVWLVVVGAGALLLALLAVLVAVLLSLEGTRDELGGTHADVARLDGRVDRFEAQARPLLDAAAPLATPAAAARARTTQRTLTDAARAVPPLAAAVPGLARDASSALALATSIARTVRSPEVTRTLAAVRAVADAATTGGGLARVLRDTDRALAAVDRTADALGRRGAGQLTCDVRLRDRAPTAPGQLGCLLRTVPNLRLLLRQVRDATTSSLGVQRQLRDEGSRIDGRLTESLAAQRAGLAATQRIEARFDASLDIQRSLDRRFAESLEIQRALLGRATSLDTKIPPLTPAAAVTSLTGPPAVP